jgi:N-formylglutamate amidohydrolase
MKWTRSIPLVALLAGALVLVAGREASVAQSAAEDLIAVTSGTLPIVITAPHGGHLPIPEVPERKSGTRVRDEATDEIAKGVAAEVEHELHGQKPSLVVARFHRKYLDVNRSEAEGLEDERAMPVYEAYHAAVRKLVDVARKRQSGHAILIDVHGQAKENDALVRGTRDGKTVKALLGHFGEVALVGTNSIFGTLAHDGYRVIPPIGAPSGTKESPHYDGGFTVATYGSSEKDGIDAIQIEIGGDIRKDPTKRKKLEHDLGAAIAAFYKAYVKR